MPIDSKQKKLNVGEIVIDFLQHNPQGMPVSVVVPAILTELSNPNVKTRQIGNTLFEIIPGKNSTAFFKAFNADTGQNFVENSKQFVVWAKHVLGLQTLVTQFTDPSIETLFKVIEANPPMPGMDYKVQKAQDGQTVIFLNLGA